MPREAPDIMTMRLPGTRSVSVAPGSATLEQPLIDAAVIDDVLAGHEAGLCRAEEGDQVAAFLRVGEAAGRAAAEAVLDDRLVGRVAARGVAEQVRLQRLGVEETGADAVDRHIVGDEFTHDRGDG